MRCRRHRRRASGVQLTSEPRSITDGVRAAFIEGPDQVAIELLEDHTTRPDRIAE
jgi:hypothetical protein